MGGGSWTSECYVTHSTTTRGFSSMDDFIHADVQELYRSKKLDDALNPYNVVRECCDTEEHPNTIPVILALDVTGSMGSAAESVAKQLGDIMSEIYKKVADVEFLTMAIGDLSYDRSPIQASQFESDIRIAEQLEKVYFEHGGGGNMWESYTAAWYFGLYHTKLDCWKRNRKGIIITLGDEMLNPYLPANKLNNSLGDTVQGDVETKDLYAEASKKFDIYHIAIDDSRTSYCRHRENARESFGKLLGQNFIETNCENLGKVISDIVISASIDMDNYCTPIYANTDVTEDGYAEVSW